MRSLNKSTLSNNYTPSYYIDDIQIRSSKQHMYDEGYITNERSLSSAKHTLQPSRVISKAITPTPERLNPVRLSQMLPKKIYRHRRYEPYNIACLNIKGEEYEKIVTRQVL